MEPLMNNLKLNGGTNKYHSKGQTSRRQPPITTCVVGVVYANWCPHCQTLVGHSEEEYPKSDWYRVKQMLEKLNDKGTKYTVEKIESAQEQEMAAVQKMGVKANGFPTIYKYYKKPGSNSGEKVEHYMGNRTPEEIVKWARNHAVKDHPSDGRAFGRYGNNFKIYGGKSRRRNRRTIRRRIR